MAELKPCPFCGRIPKIEDCGTHRYFVKCKCGIEQICDSTNRQGASDSKLYSEDKAKRNGRVD